MSFLARLMSQGTMQPQAFSIKLAIETCGHVCDFRTRRRSATGVRMSKRSPRRRGAGRAAKRAARQQAIVETAAWVDRKIPYFEVLNEEALELIEHNAETVLEEIGIEFR